jgi:hypothetical protein
MSFEKYKFMWNGEELDGTTWTEDSDVEINCGEPEKFSLDLDYVEIKNQDENKVTYSGYKDGKWACEFNLVPNSEADIVLRSKIRG